MSELFPLDFAELVKGSFIEQERIERIYQVTARENPDGFRLAQMKLVELIEKNRSDLYPRTQGNDVRIMEDREAEEYNGRRHHAHVRGLARDARRRGRINRSEFSDAERRVAESRDLGFSALALMTQRALRKAEKEARLLSASSEEELD